MILIVISGSPLTDTLYEQGIETALNLADAEIEVSVLLEGDFLDCIWANPECVGAKKLGQCKLYEVSVYSKVETELDFIKPAEIKELYSKAEKIVTF